MTASKSKPSPKVHVQVTQEIIDKAQRRDSSHCMIADAVAAAVPNARYISVDLATIRFTDPNAGVRYVYLTPRSAQAALLAFDQGEPTEPFGLRLQGAHVLATGAARQARASLVQPVFRGASKTSGRVPERRDGTSPPLGPLHSGRDRKRDRVGDGDQVDGNVPSSDRVGPTWRSGSGIGRRREYGLRAFIR